MEENNKLYTVMEGALTEINIKNSVIENTY